MRWPKRSGRRTGGIDEAMGGWSQVERYRMGVARLSTIPTETEFVLAKNAGTDGVEIHRAASHAG